VVSRCERLIQGARILGIPVSATEQYPRGLGPTVGSLATLLGRPPEKLRFSAAEAVEWSGPDDGESSRDKVVVTGIETHVCVLQTCLDLTALGFRVYVPVDAVGSRTVIDRETALQRMRDSGVVLCTTESVLFEWCEVAGTDEFKQISRLAR